VHQRDFAGRGFLFRLFHASGIVHELQAREAAAEARDAKAPVELCVRRGEKLVELGLLHETLLS